MPEESIAVIVNVGSGADDKEAMRSRLSGIFAASDRNARILLARSGEDVVELARRAALSNIRDTGVCAWPWMEK